MEVFNKSLVSSRSFHLDYLDSLRALAALYVVFAHILGQVHLPQNIPWLQKLFVDSFGLGHYAVDLFIVLSGFCLMLPVVRNNGQMRTTSLQFFKRRARRILPPYYLAMAVSLLLIFTIIGQKTGTHWDVSIPVGFKDILTHLVLLQDIFPDTSTTINHTFWSISVEWRIYFLFPLIVLAWNRYGSFWTSLVAVLGSLSIQLLLRDSTFFNFSPWGICPHFIGLFTLGCLAAEISFSSKPQTHPLHKELPWNIITILGACLLLIISSRGFLLSQNILWPLQDLIMGVWSSCLLITLASHKKSLLKTMVCWKPLTFCGTFAYSIYLIHAPLLQVMSQYLLMPLNLSPLLELVFLVVMGLPIILFMSYLFFWLCERPFLSKSKSN